MFVPSTRHGFALGDKTDGPGANTCKKKNITKKSTQSKGLCVHENQNVFYIVFIYSLFLLLLSVQLRVQKKRSRKVAVPPLLRKTSVKFHILRCLCHLSLSWEQKPEKSIWNTFLITCWIEKKMPPEPRSRRKVRKSTFEYFLDWILTRQKLPPKPRSCQKLEKSIFEYFFSRATISHFEMFVPSIYSLWEQKLEKSILNTFQIKCWIEKSCCQNQDRAKRWGNQFLNTFFTWIIYIVCFCEKRVWNFTFWDVCAIYLVVMGTKAGEINFEYFVLIKCWIEKSCRQNQDRAER